MATGDADRVRDYPLRSPAALEPPAEWSTLRRECPVARVRLPSGDEAALLTRYEDVRQVLTDPRFPRQLNAPDAARVTAHESGGVFSGALTTAMRQVDHQRWRRQVGRWFTARRMAALRPRIEGMAERLVSGMAADGPPADLRERLGFPLPVWVICELLGVPAEHRERFVYWSDTFLSLTRYSQAEIDAAQEEFRAAMRRHVARTRARPGDDLLSALVTAVDATDVMPEEALVATAQGLLVAGHETTAHMIGKMVGMLLADRRRWERLLADRTLVRTAVEEALRLDANSGFGVPRYLTADVRVGGRLVRRGTTVVCSLAAANRDERVFAAASDMALDRSPNIHLAFGAGPHACLGQALARTELQVVLEVLLRRLPDLALAVPPEELERLDGLVVGGLRRVPVRW